MSKTKDTRDKIEDNTHAITPLIGQMHFADGHSEVPKLRGYALELYKGAILKQLYQWANQK